MQVYHAPAAPAPHHPVPRVHGRLRICSASLIFEPGPTDLPLLKIPLRSVTSIEPLVGKRAQPGAGESFRVQCSSIVTLRAQGKPCPYGAHAGDQEHSFSALHSPLDAFMPFLMQLLAAAHLARRRRRLNRRACAQPAAR